MSLTAISFGVQYILYYRPPEFTVNTHVALCFAAHKSYHSKQIIL